MKPLAPRPPYTPLFPRLWPEAWAFSAGFGACTVAVSETKQSLVHARIVTYLSAESCGEQKYCSSIWSNSRVRNKKFDTEISLRNDFPIWPTPGRDKWRIALSAAQSPGQNCHGTTHECTLILHCYAQPNVLARVTLGLSSKLTVRHFGTHRVHYVFVVYIDTLCGFWTQVCGRGSSSVGSVYRRSTRRSQEGAGEERRGCV